MLERWLLSKRRGRKVLKTDPQRTRMYNMEREFIGSAYATRCTRDHIRNVVQHACQEYKVDPPKLYFVRDLKFRGFGWYNDDGLFLNESFHGANVTTLLHELAHHIVHQQYEKVEDHGPEFVKVYMQLLDRYRIIPAYAFKVMLERYNIRWK